MPRSILAFLLPLLLIAATESARAEWHSLWSKQLPARKVAWEFTPRMNVDRAYEPLVHRGLVVVGAEHNGAAIAYDVTSGEETWRFHTGGPIRVAPVTDGERIFVGSEDGSLYALNPNGTLAWKFRGGPRERFVIGHERVISAWPVSTQPLVHEGLVYFTAGYWPVESVFLYALDAKTGRVVWSRDDLDYRPFNPIWLQEETIFVDGHGGSGAYDPKTGASVNLKRGPLTPQPVIELPGGMDGNVAYKRMADGVVAAATDKGGLYVFAEKRHEPSKVSREEKELAPLNESAARELVAALGDLTTPGYCVIDGLSDGALVAGILKHTKLDVVALDADEKKIAWLRADLDRRGLFDERRLTLLAGTAATLELPPHFAMLVASETNFADRGAAANLRRPYGGVLAVRQSNGSWSLDRLVDALPGAADWSHEMADSANSLCSEDELLKAPLGLLWYGGPAADGRLYYDGNVDHQSGHGINPQPVGAQVIEGKMILQGPGVLAAIDIYTGGILWEAKLPSAYVFGRAGGGLGFHSKMHPQPWKYEPAFAFDVTPVQHSRASGFNMVSQPDAIYVAAGPKCLVFDARTGALKSEWPVPLPNKELCWGAFRAVGDSLIATAFPPQNLIDSQAGHDGQGGEYAGDRLPMSYLLVLDRATGQLRWHREAKWAFHNRAVAAAGDRVFCIDLLQDVSFAKWKEAGRKFPATGPKLYALSLADGAELWQHDLDVHVKNLAYSQERDLLLLACRNLIEWDNGAWADRSIDVRRGERNKSAVGRLQAFRGKTGEVAWDRAEAPYYEPHVLAGDLVLDRQGISYDLLTGARHERPSPLFGDVEQWSFKKGGCNYLIGSKSLLTWRCAFYDLQGQSGVMPLKGMDAGCTPTLLPAGGVLSIPNYGTHHKRNRMTAMALVHRPENELWTNYYTVQPAIAGQPVQRIGYNFGAPGDHRSPDGGVWFAAVNKKPQGVAIEPAEVRSLAQHSSRGGSPVAATAIVGAREIALPVLFGAKKIAAEAPSGKYTVRLTFLEPEDLEPGARVFDVEIEGKQVLAGFDVAREAGAPQRSVVREFPALQITGPVDIRLTPIKGETILSGVELIRAD